jgi:cell division protease FtsH
VLTKHLDQLRTITDALLEFETLSGDDIRELLKGVKPNRSNKDDGKPKALSTGGSSIPRTRKPKGVGGAAPQGA